MPEAGAVGVQQDDGAAHVSHRHVPERELALFAVDPDQIPADRRRELEEQVAACAECQESYDFFRVTEDDLLGIADTDAWEPSFETSTYESLMTYGARVAEEDRDAEVLLKEFIENPISAAWTALATKKVFRTGGVVRKLNAAAHAVCENDPLAALTFADAAISVAEALPEDLYPANAVYRLRGTAWKERANAQMRLGDFPQAHESLDRAERAYRKTPYNGLGLSIVALVRAGVMYEQDRFDEATAMAQQAELGFAHAGDEKRRMDAVFLRASIMFGAGSSRAAVPLFRQVIEYGEHLQNPRWIARGSYAIGNCEIDNGNLADASLHFHKALVIFREMGPDGERIATEWGLARVLLHSGRPKEAIHRLREVASQFEARGMVTYAALAGLDMSEAFLSVDNPHQIADLAQHLFRVFERAGMLTGALSAIAYLKEAASTGVLTSAVLNDLRSFLRRAERQPELQFVPPPT
jgi:tetratricopeptide (TPR) repeat protein